MTTSNEFPFRLSCRRS